MKKILLHLLFAILLLSNTAHGTEPKLLYTIGKASLFNELDDLAIDGLEHSYVLSRTKNTIYKIDNQGKYIVNWQLKKINNHIITNVLNSPNTNLYTIGYDPECPNSICKSLISKWSAEGKLISQWQPLIFNKSKVVISNNNQIIISTINKIHIYSDSGKLIREIRGFSSQSQASTTQSFIKIENLAINYNNELLVIDSNRKRIITINLEGHLLKEPINNNLAIDRGKTSSHSLSYDTDGFIYDSQINYAPEKLTSCNCIRKFNSQGKLVKTIGKLGSEKGQFIQPTVIALSKSNNLFVADSGNLRLQKLSPLTTPVWSYGDNLGSLKNPNGLVVDSKNNIYVLDSFHYRVQKFSKTGIFLNTWGSLGKTNGKFSNLSKIAIDTNDKLYVEDSYFDSVTQKDVLRIQTFSTEGNFLGIYDAPWPSFDQRGNVYSIIERIKSDSNQVEYFIQKTDIYSKTAEWPLNYEKNPDYDEDTSIYPCLNSIGIDTEENIYTLKCTAQRTYISPHFSSYQNSISLLKIDSKTGLINRKVLGSLETIWGRAKLLANFTINENNTIYTNIYIYGFYILNNLTVSDKNLDVIGNYPHATRRNFVYAKNSKIYTSTSDKNIIEVYNASSLFKAPLLQKVDALNSKGAVTLKWQDRTTDEIGFNVYRCKVVDIDYACTDFKLVKTTKSNITGIRLPAPPDFTPRSMYSYKVTAFKYEEESLSWNSMTISF